VSIEFDAKLRQVAALGDAAIKIMETQERQITDLKNQLQEQQTVELGNQLAEAFHSNA
jgi:aminoglycoside phosphotransferase family enzyme